MVSGWWPVLSSESAARICAGVAMPWLCSYLIADLSVVFSGGLILFPEFLKLFGGPRVPVFESGHHLLLDFGNGHWPVVSGWFGGERYRR